MRWRTFFVYLARATALMAASITVICLAWSLEPAPSVMYERKPLTPEVEPGGKFKLDVNVVWSKTCWSVIYRTLVDGAGKITEYKGQPRKNIEGRKHFVVEVAVPIEAVPGHAEWRVRTDWYCNPWQRVFPKSVDLEPISFTIVPQKGAMLYGRSLDQIPYPVHYCGVACIAAGVRPK